MLNRINKDEERKKRSCIHFGRRIVKKKKKNPGWLLFSLVIVNVNVFVKKFEIFMRKFAQFGKHDIFALSYTYMRYKSILNLRAGRQHQEGFEKDPNFIIVIDSE